ncbi:MAG: hypothetical protein AAFY60_21190 [Myxococcota bacterium]
MEKPTIQLELTEDEALVLFQWMAEFGDTLPTAHVAERAALWALEAQLEKNVPVLFAPNYDELLERARSKLREASGLTNNE